MTGRKADFRGGLDAAGSQRFDEAVSLLAGQRYQESP